MTTIVPQMAKLSVKDLLETRQRLEADILRLLNDFIEQTGVNVYAIEVQNTMAHSFDRGSYVVDRTVSVEFDL